MARATVERKIGVGTIIEGTSSSLRVVKVLKHAYKVVYKDDECPHRDLWSWEVRQDNLGQWVTDVDE